MEISNIPLNTMNWHTFSDDVSPEEGPHQEQKDTALTFPPTDKNSVNCLVGHYNRGKNYLAITTAATRMADRRAWRKDGDEDVMAVLASNLFSSVYKAFPF